MVAWCDPWAKAYDSKYRPVWNGGPDFLAGWIFIAVVVDRKSFSGPDYAVERAWALRSHVLDGLIEEYFGAALTVVACDHTADVQAHWRTPCYIADFRER